MNPAVDASIIDLIGDGLEARIAECHAWRGGTGEFNRMTIGPEDALQHLAGSAGSAGVSRRIGRKRRRDDRRQPVGDRTDDAQASADRRYGSPRIILYVYFASKQAISASAMATLRSAKVCVLASSVCCFAETAEVDSDRTQTGWRVVK